MASQKYTRIFGKCHKNKQLHANNIRLRTIASKNIQGSTEDVPQPSSDKQKPSYYKLHTIRVFPKQNNDGNNEVEINTRSISVENIHR